MTCIQEKEKAVKLSLVVIDNAVHFRRKKHVEIHI